MVRSVSRKRRPDPPFSEDVPNENRKPRNGPMRHAERGCPDPRFLSTLRAKTTFSKQRFGTRRLSVLKTSFSHEAYSKKAGPDPPFPHDASARFVVFSVRSERPLKRAGRADVFATRFEPFSSVGVKIWFWAEASCENGGVGLAFSRDASSHLRAGWSKPS